LYTTGLRQTLHRRTIADGNERTHLVKNQIRLLAQPFLAGGDVNDFAHEVQQSVRDVLWEQATILVNVGKNYTDTFLPSGTNNTQVVTFSSRLLRITH
jgi:hypothetical protein